MSYNGLFNQFQELHLRVKQLKTKAPEADTPLLDRIEEDVVQAMTLVLLLSKRRETGD